MLHNYLIIAWRNLRKHSFYSLINIVGLAIGISAALIIALFIANEFQFDKYHEKADRIFRIDCDVKFGGNDFKMAYRSAPEAHALMQDFPEVESTVRFRRLGSYLVKPAHGTENIKEKNVVWTDSTFFKVFSVNVLEGDANTALTHPASIAISKTIAHKYFPGKSALGESMILDNKYNAKITAVYDDIPNKSHFHFDILIAMAGTWPVAKEAQSTSFMSENFITYLLLKKGVNPESLEKKLPKFLEKYIGPELSKAFGSEFNMEKFEASGNRYHLSLRPLTDIHLYSDVRGDFEPNGSITYVYLLGSIAVFILVIACINFMNLSTARSSNRAKEVGVRKVMGSLRSHLVRQFLVESILITCFSFFISVALAYLFLPLFNDLSQRQLELPLTSPLFYLILVGTTLLIGVMAGMYPSIFLSTFTPMQVIKGHVSLGMKSGVIRSSLVVFQFVISIFLIIGAITVNKQRTYIQTKNLGFEKDQIIVIHDTYALRPHVQTFKDEAVKMAGVESATVSGYVPVTTDWSWRSSTTMWREGVTPNAETMVSFQNWGVDFDYIKTFKLNVKQGRAFSPDFPSDWSAVVVNETAATLLELGDDPIGKKITRFSKGLDPNSAESYVVIGVVEDFHFSSMKENIQALGLFLSPSDGSISFRFKPESTTEVIESLEKIWKRMAAGQPFLYTFLDEDFANMYDAEQRLGQSFTLFAGLAIIIACLGLFALTAFTAEQRTKEIGIRKVLGASVRSIVLLLSKDFGRLILIAFLIAAPMGWFSVNWWLETYAYKTEVGAFTYFIAGTLACVIALITMGYQSVRAANSDPVKSLRSE